MITSLYPTFVSTVTEKVFIPNMVTSIYPVPVRPCYLPEVSIPNMVTSIYPTHVQIIPPLTVPFPEPPPIDMLIPINDGKEGFVAQYGDNFYVTYSSKPNASDIIGNSSADFTNWNPAANNTDPPSHNIFAVKNPSYDCTFFPAFNMYNNNFSLAWLENNIIGRINLKYGESSSVISSVTPPVTAMMGANNTIFIRPNQTSIKTNSITQNIPLSDIYVTDFLNQAFDLNIFHQGGTPFGHEMTLVNGFKSVKFIQSFKRAGGTLKCMIGTAPQAGTATTAPVASVPIAGAQVNVYYSKTNLLLGTYFSDTNGKFAVPIKYGDFLFEIIANQASIYFSQIFL